MHSAIDVIEDGLTVRGVEQRCPADDAGVVDQDGDDADLLTDLEPIQQKIAITITIQAFLGNC